jgi:hypothetical protein
MDQYQFGMNHSKGFDCLFNRIKSTRCEFPKRSLFQFFHQPRYLDSSGKCEVSLGEVNPPVIL